MQNHGEWMAMAGSIAAEETMSRAQVALEKGNLSEAVGLFSLFLVNHPTNLEALRARCEILFRLERYQESYNDACQILQWDANDVVALNRTGQILAMSGHFDNSLADLTHLLQIDPDHFEARLHRYWVYMRTRQTHEAENDMRQLLILLPDDVAQLMKTAECFLQMGHLVSAREVLDRVLSFEPENVVALKYRGLVWRHLNVPELSVEDLTKAMEFTPDDPVLYVERADSLMEWGKRTFTKKAYRNGIQDLTRVLNEMDVPKPAVVHCLRAQIWTLLAERSWFDKSGYKKALDDFDTAVKCDGEYEEAYLKRAQLLWKQGQAAAVIEDCTKILNRHPNHTDALYLRAEAYLSQKEPDLAEADFNAIDRMHELMAQDAEKTREENRRACDELHGGCGGQCHGKVA